MLHLLSPVKQWSYSVILSFFPSLVLRLPFLYELTFLVPHARESVTFKLCHLSEIVLRGTTALLIMNSVSFLALEVEVLSIMFLF